MKSMSVDVEKAKAKTVWVNVFKFSNLRKSKTISTLCRNYYAAETLWNTKFIY